MTRIEKETIIRALEQHAKSQSDIEQNARERGEPDLAIKAGREKNVAVGLVSVFQGILDSPSGTVRALGSFMSMLTVNARYSTQIS